MHRVLILLIPLSISFASNKYAADIEDLDASARTVGMGGCGITAVDDPSVIYYNPSGSALLENSEIMGMHSENFGGVVKNDFLGAVFPTQGQSFGVALYHNGVPDILVNPILPHPDEEPSDSNQPYGGRMVNAHQWILYLNYAKSFSSLSLGGNLKFIYHHLGVGSAYGMGIDFGLLIQPSKGLRVGLRVRNLSTSPLFYSTNTREFMIPRLSLGIAKGFSIKEHSILFTLEGEANFEGIGEFSYARIGGVSLEERIGIEYTFKRVISLRMGLCHRVLSLGIGGTYQRYFLDYGYQDSEIKSSHRISGGIRF